MNLSGSKTILLFFFLPTPLKLHGDVEIYASGRNFGGIYKVSYQIHFRFSVEFIRTRKKFFREKSLKVSSFWLKTGIIA